MAAFPFVFNELRRLKVMKCLKMILRQILSQHNCLIYNELYDIGLKSYIISGGQYE